MPLALQLQQPPAFEVIIDACVSDHYKPGLISNIATYLLPEESFYNFIASYSKTTFFKFAGFWQQLLTIFSKITGCFPAVFLKSCKTSYNYSWLLSLPRKSMWSFNKTSDT